MTIDSFPDLAAAILPILAKKSNLQLAIVFGSVAAGTARPDSDLDIAVNMGHPLDVDEKIRWIGDLSAAVGRPIDLIDLCTIGEPLLGQILKHGKRLAGSDTRYAELILRHVYADADFVPYQNRILAERRKTWIGS